VFNVAKKGSLPLLKMGVILTPGGARTTSVPLPDVTIEWQRVPLSKEVHDRVHALSDARAFAQAGGFCALLLGTLAGAVWSSTTPRVWLTVGLSLLYGLQANFLINGMHELGHGAVFRTRWLNAAFLRLVSFLGWLHPDLFFSSHLRHHRFTQHPPHDLENPMPIRISAWDFIRFGVVDVRGAAAALAQTGRAALGRFPTGHLGWLPGWEEYLYPEDGSGEARAAATAWARILLLGHGGLAAAAWALGWPPLLPALVSGGPFFNGWLFFLCNSTQHVGLEPSVADFRRNTRTFTLHPAIRFLYWQMNYHIEHHMYANVPCYNLAELHEAIKHDLPPTPDGLLAVWRDIGAAMARVEAAEAGKKAA
jgi:fatty acid desaturase